MLAEGQFASNRAGGVLGGISTGAPLQFRVAVKPTASIAQPQQTIDTEGSPATVVVQGRHDPCIVPRIVPVIEAMTALVLADAWLQYRAGASL
jgi:chorismate synthase